jgi:hypothetical protein
MSDGKKQGDENWRKFTADDLTAALNGKPTRIRYRDKESQEWETGTEKYIQEMCKRSQCKDVIEVLPWLKFSCEVLVEPAPTRSPKDGCRMLEDNEEPMPGDEKWRDATPEDVLKVLKGETIRARVREEATENWVSTDVDGYDLHITGWHRDKFIDSEGSHWSLCQVPVESGPPSSIGLTYDPWTDTVSKVVRTDETGKVVESISAPWKPLVGDAVRWVYPEDKRHGTEGTIVFIQEGLSRKYSFESNCGQFKRWCAISELEPISKSDRPVPKGFRLLGDEPRLLGDEPRLASDGYWSLSCKDWLVIGDRIGIANRDKWPAIRLVVDEPEPVKQFILANDQDNEQALYVNGKLGNFEDPIYGYEIAQAANGCAIKIESREVERQRPEEGWPTKLSDLEIVDELEDPSGESEPTNLGQIEVKHPGQDPASVFGSDPIEVRPIMQIRLPGPASVLGKLGDMLEKHYPGSTMRQVGGYLVFEEPIES